MHQVSRFIDLGLARGDQKPSETAFDIPYRGTYSSLSPPLLLLKSLPLLLLL
jgi:hypothetical protein